MHSFPPSRLTRSICLSIGIGTVLFALLRKARDVYSPWAEDATLLFLGSLESPLGVFDPVLDGVFLISRLMSSIAVGISLAAAPLIIDVLSIATLVGLSIYILKDSFAWLLPSFGARQGFSIALALGAGALEVGGNAICLMYIFGVFLVLVSLEKPLLKESVFFPTILVLVLSTTLSMIALPILGARFLMERKKVYLQAIGICLLGTTINLALASVTVSAQNQIVIPSIQSLFASMFVDVQTNCLIFPLLGNLLPSGFPYSTLDPPVLLLTLLLGLSYFWLLFQADASIRLASLSLMAATLLYCLSHQITRPYHTNYFFLPAIPIVSRAFFVTITLPLLSWLILICSYNNFSHFLKMTLITTICAMQLLPALHRAVNADWIQPSDDWRTFADSIEVMRKDEPKGVQGERTASVWIGPGLWAEIVCSNATGREVICEVRGGNGAVQSYRF